MNHSERGSNQANVVWTLRPSLISIVLRPFWWFVLATTISVIIVLIALRTSNLPPEILRGMIFWAIAIMVARLCFETVVWMTTTFTLTRTAISTRRGIVQRTLKEVPLHAAQHLQITRSALQRVGGAGTIAVGTGAGIEVILDWISDPEAVLNSIRSAMEQKRGGRPPVLGLVGSIGAGKSALARELSKLGCVVLDSDAAAKECLTRPAVRQQLVDWFGNSILNAAGEIDRAAMAAIIFNDFAKKEKMTSLVYPLLKADRTQAVAGAPPGTPAIIIDAPLLYEAGVDAECDGVICVDAPRDQRLARVAARGWTPEELLRREQAQLPLEQKKTRSKWFLMNDQDPSRLDAFAAAILQELGRPANSR